METKIVFFFFALTLCITDAVDGERTCDWTMPSNLSEEEQLSVTKALELPPNTPIGDKVVQGKCMPMDECPFFVKLNLLQSKSKIIDPALCDPKEEDNGKNLHCCPNLPLPKCKAPAFNRNKRASKPQTNTFVTPTAEILHFNNSLHPNRYLFPSTLDCEQKETSDDPLRNGEDSFPWMVRLGYTQINATNSAVEFLCAGSLISNRYVLTAAHCIVDAAELGYKLKVARLGKFSDTNVQDCTVVGDKQVCSSDTIDFPIEDVVVHSEYVKPVEYRNDIALVRLSLQVQFTDSTRPVCLAFGKVISRLSRNFNAFIAGWGRAGNDSDIFQKAETPLTDLETCRTAYSKVVQLDFSQQFCAGGNSYQDTCIGNSGAPLIVRDQSSERRQIYVMGIVSFGPEMCGRVSVPAVYTWVPAYSQWILDHIKA